MISTVCFCVHGRDKRMPREIAGQGGAGYSSSFSSLNARRKSAACWAFAAARKNALSSSFSTSRYDWMYPACRSSAFMPRCAHRNAEESSATNSSKAYLIEIKPSVTSEKNKLPLVLGEHIVLLTKPLDNSIGGYDTGNDDCWQDHQRS